MYICTRSRRFKVILAKISVQLISTLNGLNKSLRNLKEWIRIYSEWTPRVSLRRCRSPWNAQKNKRNIRISHKRRNNSITWCIFIIYYNVSRKFWKIQKQMKMIKMFIRRFKGIVKQKPNKQCNIKHNNINRTCKCKCNSPCIKYLWEERAWEAASNKCSRSNNRCLHFQHRFNNRNNFCLK